MTDFITLKNGPVVPVEVLTLALDLECRGYRLLSDGVTLRVVGLNGPPILSATDRENIVRWKLYLLALVAYCQEEH